MHTEITACRMCGDQRLTSLLDLGIQHLTGIFPKDPGTHVSKGPLELVLCEECGLVQLRHSYDLAEMYGPHYGYRSSLNRSMVEHLKAKIGRLKERYPVGEGDFVLDIGANDGTSLSFYPENGAVLCGMDPSAEKFRKYYRPDINLVVDFFSAARFRQEFGQDARPKIVTSIAMFYDLEEPLEFVRQIKEILHPQGVWHFEQSYLPLMLAANAYDTICHEHLEYYGLKQIKWMADRAELEILDVETNLVNGGSFAITVGHKGCGHERNDQVIETLLDEEGRVCIASKHCYEPFGRSVKKHREELLELLRSLKSQGKTVLGYGASTKGNVILQYCGIDASLLPAIAEVNESKFGAVTPGTLIPIISEAEARAMKPDCFLVLPWHFKNNIVEREREFLASGGKLIFPLPAIEIVGG